MCTREEEEKNRNIAICFSFVRMQPILFSVLFCLQNGNIFVQICYFLRMLSARKLWFLSVIMFELVPPALLACMHDIIGKNEKRMSSQYFAMCSNVQLIIMMLCSVCNIQNIISKRWMHIHTDEVVKSVHCSSIIMLPLSLHIFRLYRKSIICYTWYYLRLCLLNISLLLTLFGLFDFIFCLFVVCYLNKLFIERL